MYKELIDMNINQEELNRAVATIGEAIQQMFDMLKPIAEQIWEQIKKLEQEYEETVPPEFKRVIENYNLKHAYIQSQIFDRKPRCIRARTSC
jgi:hypothetical protein